MRFQTQNNALKSPLFFSGVTSSSLIVIEPGHLVCLHFQFMLSLFFRKRTRTCMTVTFCNLNLNDPT